MATTTAASPQETRRSYRQYCGIARALDVVGERWTLLVIRELMTGPKRFKDLLDGLPGIGTNLLTARLKQLEEDGLLRRTILPPPAKVPAYELTPLGQRLEPVLSTPGDWGQELLGPPCEGEYLDIDWLMIGMKRHFMPERAAGVFATYEFRVDEQTFHVIVEDGLLEVIQGAARRPVATLLTDTHTYLSLGIGHLSLAEAVDSGRARIDGDRSAMERCAAMFRVPER